MDFVPFELKNIIEYIPFCIIIVIILISTLTWNVLTDKIHYLVTLIAIFIWAIYLYIGDSKSLWEWDHTATNANGRFILPRPAPATGVPPQPQPGQTGQWIMGIIAYYKGTLVGLIVCIVIIAIGLALGTNIKDSDKKMPINDGSVFTGIGSFITVVSIIAGIFVIISLFKDGISDDKKNAIITPVSLISLAVGIYLIVTGKNIDQNMKDGKPIDDTKVVNVNMQEIKLGFGLFMQISAILGLLLIFFKTGGLHGFDTTTTPDIIVIALRYVLILVLCLTGISLTAISSDKDTGDVKSYLSHGITYLILGFIALILCGGGLIKFTTYVVSGSFLLFILFSLFCWNWNRIREELERIRDYSDINKISQDSDKKNSFYTQIRDEAIAEYKKEKRGDVAIDSNGNISSTNQKEVKDAVDSKITDRLIKMKNREEPNLILNIFIILISLILVFATAYFRYIKYKITDAQNLPRESVSWYNFFSDINDFAGVNYQLPAGGPQRPIPKFPNNDKYFAHDKIDNLTGNDWNDVVSLKNNQGAAPLNNELNFSTGIVYAASASRWNMFISIILIVMWVLAIYAHIISSDKTEEWIATSFDVTMFSKIKELISAFFFTIIAALAIAAILLIPAVKEFNTDAVDNLLKFAESIQVWQWDEVQSVNVGWWKWVIGIIVYIGIILVFILPVVLPFLNDPKNTDNDKLPGGIKAYIVIVCLFFWFFKSAFASFFAGDVVDGYKLESGIIRFFRSILTSFYLIPLFGLSVLKFIIFGLVCVFTLFQIDDIKDAASESGKTMMSLFFGVGIPSIGVKGLTGDTDLRFFKNMFNTGSAPPAAAEVSTVTPQVSVPPPSNQAAISIDQTKVSVVTKLIKTIIIIVSCIMVVLTIVYGFYQLKQKSFTSTSSDGTTTSSTSGIDPATSTFMGIVFVLIGIAGGVAFIRDRAVKSGVENPEKLIFDDYHPEDEKSPTRQLTFAMIHIIYVVLMIIVWVYDREVDKQNKMSVIGMSILGIFIILFHYCLEIIDTPDTPNGPGMLSLLFQNIRFLVNSVFLILICVLLYYKMHALMAALIVVMFMFHLSKSKIGLVLLKLIWLCIIYIPCMILDAIVGGKNMIGATTRPIWIILAVEVILLSLLVGGPYLINKIGASKSQIILAPVPLMRLNDTKLTTESSEIFIYHNTGMNRSASDASCPPEEKKRYNYSVSGWFWINGSVTNKDADLAILDFAGVPKITYNPFKTSFKVSCKTLGTDGTVSENSKPKIIYESRNNSLEQNVEYKEMVMANNLQISKHIPLQKWTYFVINYDGKTIDIFLNDELVGKSDFIMPNITVERITTGQSEDGTGLNGNICNVVFSKTPMTAEQIRWTYNTLKTLDPPLIGTKTVVDEINSVGKTDVYSK